MVSALEPYKRVELAVRAAAAAGKRLLVAGSGSQEASLRLLAEGIQLAYHNHHVDLAQFDGGRIFDIVRRVAPSLYFEVDLHWVQRGGMAPLDMLAAYSGVCKLIHVKDFRVVPVSQETVDKMASGDFAGGFQGFLNIAQFAEVGQGNMNWPALLPASLDAGAEFFFIEQFLYVVAA